MHSECYQFNPFRVGFFVFYYPRVAPGAIHIEALQASILCKYSYYIFVDLCAPSAFVAITKVFI